MCDGRQVHTFMWGAQVHTLVWKAGELLWLPFERVLLMKATITPPLLARRDKVPAFFLVSVVCRCVCA
jgi:hypothetical protein